MQKSKIFVIGLAIFTMLFGAGNVVFPLEVGRAVGDKVWFAMLGLIVSGVIIPLLGLIASMMFNGDYKKFLSTVGTIPGALVALVCMALLGPFGATPRCLSLAYAAVKWHIPSISIFVFSLAASVLVFLCTIRKSGIVAIMGKILGPIKLVLLFSLIIIGVIHPNTSQVIDIAPWSTFLLGLREGYWTLDLLATIFFSGLIIAAIKKQDGEDLKPVDLALIGLKAGIIGATLLGVVYAGFCGVSAMYGSQIMHVGQDQLLSALAMIILGSHAGILANITMSIACLSTAIALTAVFADYLRSEIFKEKVSYSYSLLLTVVITFIMANLGFARIMIAIEPVAKVLLPAVTVLVIANLAQKVYGFKYIKMLFFTTLIATVAINFLPQCIICW
jgi:LIVCS family branched-chain amino acid:cation transporter